MAEAVGDATTVDLVAIALQLERITAPLLRIGRHSVHVRTHKADDLVGGARVVDDHVGAVGHIGELQEK